MSRRWSWSSRWWFVHQSTSDNSRSVWFPISLNELDGWRLRDLCTLRMSINWWMSFLRIYSRSWQSLSYWGPGVHCNLFQNYYRLRSSILWSCGMSTHRQSMLRIYSCWITISYNNSHRTVYCERELPNCCWLCWHVSSVGFDLSQYLSGVSKWEIFILCYNKWY